jgi:peptidoglycan/xylan/chitin deacetylase (PgdA/CDA1 family)
MSVKANIKATISRAAERSGIFGFSRRSTRNLPRIVVYHNFCGPRTPDNNAVSSILFRQHLNYYTKHYQVERLDRLAKNIRESFRFTQPTMALTIDDGHLNMKTWCYPLLKEFRLPATLFVVSSLISGREWLWTDKLDHVFQMMPGMFSREQQAEISRALKRLNVRRREDRLQQIYASAGVEIPVAVPERYAMADVDDLREMVASGLVDIGSHTKTHPILSMDNKKDAWEEIAGSRQDLQNLLGIEVSTFCFPNGHSGDYLNEHVEMVSRAGYSCATASDYGLVTQTSNLYALPRMSMHFNDSFNFKKHLDGVEYLHRRYFPSESRA